MGPAVTMQFMRPINRKEPLERKENIDAEVLFLENRGAHDDSNGFSSVSRKPVVRMNRQGTKDAKGQDLSRIHAVIKPDFRSGPASRGPSKVPPLPAHSSISWKRGSEGYDGSPLHPHPNSRIEFEMNTFHRQRSGPRSRACRPPRPRSMSGERLGVPSF